MEKRRCDREKSRRERETGSEGKKGRKRDEDRKTKERKGRGSDQQRVRYSP